MVKQAKEVQKNNEEKTERLISPKRNLAVRERDYKYIKTWSFNKDMKMIDAVSVIVEKMKEESIEEIKGELKFMYFINEEHKRNFANFLDERSTSKNDKAHLVAFYVNAIPSITTGNYFRTIKLFGWTGQFNKERKEFIPSERFLTLSRADQQLVNLAKNLFDSSNEFNMNEGLKVVDSSYLPLIQEMIRLSLMGIPNSKQ